MLESMIGYRLFPEGSEVPIYRASRLSILKNRN